MPSVDRPGLLRATPAQMARKGGQNARRGALRQVVRWYVMRATRISTGLLVYWESHTVADLTGAQSAYFGDVANVVVLYIRTE